jgi:putative DNA primase/helicase
VTDTGANGADHAVPEQPPRFSTAEDVNPPLPGDPGYDHYVARRAEWMLELDQQRAETPGVELTFTPYFDAGLGRMVTPEDPAPEVEPAVDAASSGGGADAPVSRDDIARGQPRPWQRTDAANGELFAQLYGHRVRFDHRRGHWLLWGGDWWRPDETGEVRIFAKEAARLRYEEATRIEDLRARTQEAGFAIRSENRYRLEAMLAQARSEPPIADAGDSWDADLWLFGVSNGIVDLRTGRLRPGRPTDLVTLHTNVVFDPDATCPRFERFVYEVFDGDDELIGFIQRAVGYSLTGDISEQCLFLCHGSGANGKSVFLTILRALAGRYGYNAPFATFELRNRASIPNDLAALAGRRLVTASEVTENARFNEARIKELTGGDKVTARFLNHEFFEFDPVLKLWLAVNHLPTVLDDSYGFWRRVRLIPFTQRFSPDTEPALLETLLHELPGILAWAVRGALAWQEQGLGSPAAVKAATATYKEESDPLGDFLSERCIEGAGFEVKASAVYVAYRSWAEDEGIRDRDVMSNKVFGIRMTARFTKLARKTGKVYLGVGLRETRSMTAPGVG